MENKTIKKGDICIVKDIHKEFGTTITGTLVKVISDKHKNNENLYGCEYNYMVQILNCPIKNPEDLLCSTFTLPAYALEVI